MGISFVLPPEGCTAFEQKNQNNICILDMLWMQRHITDASQGGEKTRAHVWEQRLKEG